VNMLGRRTKLAEPRHRMKGAQEFDIEDGFHDGSARLNDLINIFCFSNRRTGIRLGA
jgi:hypothetical protein